MEKKSQLTNTKEIISFLAEQFPKSFSTEGKALPLKIGIFQDIVARLNVEISKTQLRSALRTYTSSWRYLHGLKNATHRVDLDGNQDAAIEQQHVEFAIQKLNESKAKVNAMRKKKELEKTTQSHTIANKTTGKRKVNQKIKNPKVKNSNTRLVLSTETKNIKNITELQQGQKIKVKLGNGLMSAIVTKLGKDTIKIQTHQGLDITVRKEHIVI